jgi:hypothetical protein
MRIETIGRPIEHDGLSSLRFDYNSVSSSLAKFLKGQADRIRRHCATSTIQIGRALLEAKRHLSHGAFLRWVEWEVCIPVRTAQAYMRVASWAADKGATVAHLSPSSLYLLSASSTPTDFVSRVLSRAEVGEYIAPSVMRAELRALRASDQQKHLDAEVPTLTTTEGNLVQLMLTDESKSSDGLAELVSILIKALSPSDFARVRDIVTSDPVVTDPQLAQSLGRVFQCTTQVYLQQNYHELVATWQSPA